MYPIMDQPNYQLGGILTASAITKEIERGRIKIDQFDPACLGANSYDIHIGDTYGMYEIHRFAIDPQDQSTFRLNTFTFPKEGEAFYPGKLYLVSTKEKVGSDYFEPILTGRSSSGRLGISVHREAGFGDIGFYGNWTFQITVAYPTIIRAGMRLGQVYFISPCGEVDKLYSGKYKDSEGIQGSKMYKDVELIGLE